VRMHAYSDFAWSAQSPVDMWSSVEAQQPSIAVSSVTQRFVGGSAIRVEHEVAGNATGRSTLSRPDFELRDMHGRVRKTNGGHVRTHRAGVAAAGASCPLLSVHLDLVPDLSYNDAPCSEYKQLW
jgi:hypothetical protein